MSRPVEISFASIITAPALTLAICLRFPVEKRRKLHALMRIQIQALLAATLIPLFALNAAPPEAPKDIVQAFYTAHFKDFDSFGPGLHKKERWLSKGFLGAIHAYQQSSSKHQTKGDVEGFDGDLFTDAQDEPSSFSVGDATVKGDHADVRFSLVLADKKKVYETRKCIAKLVNENGAWKVDNLVIDKDDMRKQLAEFSRGK